MAERVLPGWVKPTLELGPVGLFFAVFLLVRNETYTIAGTEYSGFIMVTVWFIPVFLASTALLWALTGKLSPMQVFTSGLITVLGALTFFLNDEKFLKIRPTLVYGLFASILGFGLWRGTSYLSLVLSEAMPITQEGWMILTRRMVGLFAGLAVINELTWRFLPTTAWVTIETFGFPALMIGFLFSQYKLIEAHSLEDKDTPEG